MKNPEDQLEKQKKERLKIIRLAAHGLIHHEATNYYASLVWFEHLDMTKTEKYIKTADEENIEHMRNDREWVSLEEVRKILTNKKPDSKPLSEWDLMNDEKILEIIGEGKLKTYKELMESQYHTTDPDDYIVPENKQAIERLEQIIQEFNEIALSKNLINKDVIKDLQLEIKRIISEYGPRGEKTQEFIKKQNFDKKPWELLKDLGI